jgi:hypothetical protein
MESQIVTFTQVLEASKDWVAKDHPGWNQTVYMEGRAIVPESKCVILDIGYDAGPGWIGIGTMNIYQKDVLSGDSFEVIAANRQGILNNTIEAIRYFATIPGAVGVDPAYL